MVILKYPNLGSPTQGNSLLVSSMITNFYQRTMRPTKNAGWEFYIKTESDI